MWLLPGRELLWQDTSSQHKIENSNFSMLQAIICSAQKNLASVEHYINNLDHTLTVIKNIGVLV